jgi:hypothetical protein
MRVARVWLMSILFLLGLAPGALAAASATIGLRADTWVRPYRR